MKNNSNKTIVQPWATGPEGVLEFWLCGNEVFYNLASDRGPAMLNNGKDGRIPCTAMFYSTRKQFASRCPDAVLAVR